MYFSRRLVSDYALSEPSRLGAFPDVGLKDLEAHWSITEPHFTSFVLMGNQERIWFSYSPDLLMGVSKIPMQSVHDYFTNPKCYSLNSFS